MKTLWLKEPLKYDGTQLRSLWAYRKHGELGPSCVAFRGPCSVTFEHMVDLEDLRQESRIEGSDMVHFIVELFDRDLFSAVAFQRLIADIVSAAVTDLTDGKVRLSRDGDDLYWQDRKFSISIATLSPVSQLIHFAFNLSNEGTPVPTCALSDFGLAVEPVVERVLHRIAREYDSCLDATRKVRPVD